MSSRFARAITDSNLSLPLNILIADILNQLPDGLLPDVNQSSGWGAFYDAHRSQTKFGQFHHVRLPDIDCVAFLREQLKDFNPHCREIKREHDYRYLERYYLYADDEFSLDLHRFLASDIDPLHDHPWEWSCSILLHGTCQETFLVAKPSQTVTYPKQPGTVSLQAEHDYHRVELLDGQHGGNQEIYTLFLHSRQRCGGFGFLQPAGNETVRFDNKQRSFIRYIVTDPGGSDNRQSYPSLRTVGPRAREVWAGNGEGPPSRDLSEHWEGQLTVTIDDHQPVTGKFDRDTLVAHVAQIALRQQAQHGKSPAPLLTMDSKQSNWEIISFDREQGNLVLRTLP